MKIKDRLQEDSKERFRPILPFINKARQGEDELLDAALTFEEGDIEDLHHLHHLRQEFLNALRDSAASLLMRHGHQMDLSPDDINAKILHQQTVVEHISAPPTKTTSTSSFSLDRDLILLDYLNVLEKMLLDITQISGGRIIRCFLGPEFFPVVNTGFLNPRRGESISTRLSVGSYATTLDPEDITIIIEGDSLKPNMAGYIDYDFVAHRRGKQELEMELVLKNPLTGEVNKQGITKYHYFVR
jgi:hypothetical protein